MIECQYCYTRNKNDAPKCESCGAPLEIHKSKSNNFVNNVHYNFVDSGTTPSGLSAKQFEKRIMDVLRKQMFG